MHCEFNVQESPCPPIHALIPSQTEAPAHSLAGSVSALTGPHVPFGPCPPLDTVEQAWQVPLQAVSQQTLSTQWLLKQSPAIEHAAPLSSLQAEAPLQEPAVHSFSGSLPALMGPQTPFVPCPLIAAEQATQLPEQAVSQQTPSAQNALRQSLLREQASPASSLQTPAPLQEPGVHSASGSEPDWMGPQEPSVPWPLMAAVHAWQFDVQAELQQTPSAQNMLRHCELSEQPAPISSLQAPEPLHEPFVHSFCGSEPALILPQVPSEPLPLSDAEQAWQGDKQELLQQTPSAQNPLKQSAATPQAWPLSFLQTPAPSHDCAGPEQVTVSSWLMATKEQTPAAPARLHDLHVSVQAVLQQTVSTQWALKQSAFPTQALPSFVLQTPAASQDLVPLQILAGLVSSIETSVVQVPTLPTALHVRQAVLQALLQQTPSAQKALTQSAATVQDWPLSFLQTPLPSHAFTPIHVGVSSFALGTFEHLPTLAATLHALQVPLHAESQQTPSAQKVLRQSEAAAQTWPSAFLQSPEPLQSCPPDWLQAAFSASFGFDGTPAGLQTSFVH